MSDETSSLRVLLVDDDATFRERLATALRARGFIISTAPGFTEAIDLAGAGAADAALVDLRMPGPGGLLVVKALQELRPGIRIVILTGYGSIATAMEAVRTGASDYLTKPADTDAIARALRGERRLPPVSPPLAIATLDRLEWEHIQRVLGETGGNISETARILGIDRRSLQRKLAKLAPRR